MQMRDAGSAYSKYLELVGSAWEQYTEKVTGLDKLGLSWWPEEPAVAADQREVINLWNYWQGVDAFAEGEPHIRYLLMGQDWGSIDADDPFYQLVRDNIHLIRSGDANAQYYSGVDDSRVCDTDANLITLFRELGYDDIRNQRYPDLFFTNFCLGYRTGAMSGGMSMSAMKSNGNRENFKTLCDLLKPAYILCLGSLTYHCVWDTLSKNSRRPDAGKKYTDFLDDFFDCGSDLEAESAVSSDSVITYLFPLAHCGSLGTLNRVRKGGEKGISKEMGMRRMKEDWRRIADLAKSH